MKKCLLCMALAMLGTQICNNFASAHPSDGYEPNALPAGYGTTALGWGAEFNWGDLTFSAPYPSPSALTDAERYMLAGTKESGSASGLGYLPWINQTISAITLCVDQLGYVPNTLTPDVFAKAGKIEPSLIEPAVAELMKSPIDGDFPRLDALTFSPGDLYVRVLSSEEVQHFSKTLSTLKDLTESHRLFDAQSNEYQPAREVGRPMYVRVYGKSQVIYENVVFSSYKP